MTDTASIDRPVWAGITKTHKTFTFVRELSVGETHTVLHGSPTGWAEARGATHTLYCGEGHGRGLRPARLLKTVLWVGTDEAPTWDATDTKIVWEKWDIKTLETMPVI